MNEQEGIGMGSVNCGFRRPPSPENYRVGSFAPSVWPGRQRGRMPKIPMRYNARISLSE